MREWQELPDGVAARFELNDGTHVVGVIWITDGEATVEFFADCDDIANIDTQSEKLGEFSDVIDDLQPQDVIDICAGIYKTSEVT